MPLKCKFCGATAPEGATKCPFCGTFFEQSATYATQSAQSQRHSADFSNESLSSDYNEFDFFAREDWSECWDDFAAGGNAGIVLTDTSALTNKEYFLQELASYVKARQPQVRYTLLDISHQAAQKTSADCDEIVSLLTKIYNVAVPSYLLIVGDETVIPFIKWENEAGDDDKYVPSDLAYLTLDTSSPWSGVYCSFEDVTKLGRLPSSAENGFAEAIQYFKFTAEYKPQTQVNGFAYTAYVWENASREIFEGLKCQLETSPNYTTNSDYIKYYGLSRLYDLSEYNLLGINLHGSDATHDWYGQLRAREICIEAFDAGCLPNSKTGYALCVEACYGARPKVLKGKDQSIVVTALKNKCVAFVGSTRIAFGASRAGDLCCADVIAQTFLESLIAGKTSGAAYLDSLVALMASGDDEDTIKTLAEFALYGDPSVSVFATNQPSTFASSSKRAKKVAVKRDGSRAIKLIPCGGESSQKSNFAFSNYAAEVKKAEKTVQMINEVSSGYVAKNFAAFTDVKPEIFKVAGADSYRTVYSQTIGSVKNIVKLHVDGNGTIRKTYVSK